MRIQAKSTESSSVVVHLIVSHDIVQSSETIVRSPFRITVEKGPRSEQFTRLSRLFLLVVCILTATHIT